MTAARTAHALLANEVTRLEADHAALMVELAAARSEYARAVADNERLAAASADLLADNARMRAALRMVVDRGRPVPRAEEPGTVGVVVVFDEREWGVVSAASGGYPAEGHGEVAQP